MLTKEAVDRVAEQAFLAGQQQAIKEASLPDFLHDLESGYSSLTGDAGYDLLPELSRASEVNPSFLTTGLATGNPGHRSLEFRKNVQALEKYFLDKPNTPPAWYPKDTTAGTQFNKHLTQGRIGIQSLLERATGVSPPYKEDADKSPLSRLQWALTPTHEELDAAGL